MYKFVFTDLDGTLFPTATLDIDDGIKNIINEIKNKSVKFVLNTGRPYDEIPSKLKEVCDFIISSNGSMITNAEKKNIRIVSLDIEDVKRIYEFVKTNNLLALYFINGKPCFEKDFYKIKFEDKNVNNYFDFIKNKIGQYVENIIDYLVEDNKSVQKIMLALSDDDMQRKIKEELKIKYPLLNIAHSFKGNIEINAKDANKGLAIKWFMDNYHITKDEIIVCGDNNNDLSMFDYADTVIVPEDGSDEAKNKATIISESPLYNGVIRKVNEIICQQTKKHKVDVRKQ